MAKVTLWRTYWDYRQVKVGSFEADEKGKTYRRIGRGDEVSDYSTVIHKVDIGRRFYFSAIESIQGFLADCQNRIDADLFEISKMQDRQTEAQALLESYHG